jgi:hypothetical protein
VVVTAAVSLATQPKPEHELRGLVWGLTETEEAEARDQVTGMASLFDLRVVIGGLLTSTA